MVSISSAARQELVRAVSERYRTTVSGDEKGRILDEFVALSGYHRKHAIRVLNGVIEKTASTTRGRLRLYDEAVRQALIVFWEASDRICGKRLKPLLPVLLPALEGHGHVKLDPTVRAHLLAVSAATIDRLLSGARALAGGRRSRAKTTPAARRRVPVRTFADWHEPAPGFVEADLVVHCGESMAGSFASTLVLTDIASGWTENASPCSCARAV
jgi:hypothetical protein